MKKKSTSAKLTAAQTSGLMGVLAQRFEKNTKRHKGIDWKKVSAKLEANPGKLWSLHEMERTGGEPDVIGYDKATDSFIFCDCAPESPKERRSLCYDDEALDARKEFKPAGSAVGMATEMGIRLMNEEEYRSLQATGKFDTKTSSWLDTPDAIRKLGGALFGDRRYDHVFIYHNGVQSYYAARAFRGILHV